MNKRMDIIRRELRQFRELPIALFTAGVVTLFAAVVIGLADGMHRARSVGVHRSPVSYRDYGTSIARTSGGGFEESLAPAGIEVERAGFPVGTRYPR